MGFCRTLPRGRADQAGRYMEPKEKNSWKKRASPLVFLPPLVLSTDISIFSPLPKLLAELPGTDLQPASHSLCHIKILLIPSKTVLPEGTSGQSTEWVPWELNWGERMDLRNKKKNHLTFPTCFTFNRFFYWLLTVN